MQDLFENLNEAQLDAVTSLEGSVLVLAGAGSGKTRVLIRRIASLIIDHNVQPRNILAVTFTNKATAEMKERLSQILGSDAPEVWVSTFHSTALRILRMHATKLGYRDNFVVYDDQDSKGLLKKIILSHNIDEKKYSVNAYAACFDRAKNNFKDDLDSSLPHVKEVYSDYKRQLLAANAMDFGDLLVNVLRVFQDFPEVLEIYRKKFHYILVDEFQDTNRVQYLLIQALSYPRFNTFVVGDDDQSIYAFRGAKIENILNFEKEFQNAKIIKLEQNYRSTQNILNASNAVIQKNRGRRSKELWTSGDKGSPVCFFCGYNEAAEAEFIARMIKEKRATGVQYKDIAVFYRTNSQSRAIEEELVKARVPYKIFGGLKFYDRAEIKDILAYLRLIINPDDTQAFLRAINTPTRGIGAKAIDNITTLASEKYLSLWEASKLITENTKVVKFVELFESFLIRAKELVLSELIKTILEETGYLSQLRQSKDIQAESRIENLQEFQSIATSVQNDYEDNLVCLSEFLDRVVLSSSADILDEQETQVSLMTLHLAKGLEFRVVFFSGLEEGLLPHKRSITEPGGIEEERRLCYVGMTRAKEELYLTRSKKRGFGSYDGMNFVDPSRYLNDIPAGMLKMLNEDSFSGYVKPVRSTFEDSFVKPIRPKSEIKVMIADDLGLDLSTLKKATFDDLNPGVKIIHPFLGRGEIVEVENDVPTDKAKVVISFENPSETKKLLWSKANLHLC